MIGKTKLIAALFLASVAAGAVALPQEINVHLAEFAREVRSANARFAAATNALPKKYIADLSAMQKKFQSDGLLDELLAVKSELTRFQTALAAEADPFEEVPEMPEEALVDTPEMLRQLQDKYLASRREIFSQLSADIDTHSEKLLKRIESMKKDLTRQNRIEEAMEVKGAEERLKQAIGDGAIMDYIARIAQQQRPDAGQDRADQKPADPKAAATPPQPGERKAPRAPQAWQKWTYMGDRPFSPDLRGLFNPDIQPVIEARVVEKVGKIVFQSIRECRPQQIGGTLCQWVGAAAIWGVSDVSQLPVDIKISSRKLATMIDKGPQLFIYVFGSSSANVPIQSMKVELMQSECVVKILRDTQNPERFTIFWPKAGRSKPFTLAADAKVTVVIGVSLFGSREICDTTVQFE